jgi:hypothetical protein
MCKRSFVVAKFVCRCMAFGSLPQRARSGWLVNKHEDRLAMLIQVFTETGFSTGNKAPHFAALNAGCLLTDGMKTS